MDRKEIKIILFILKESFKLIDKVHELSWEHYKDGNEPYDGFINEVTSAYSKVKNIYYELAKETIDNKDF